MGKIEDKKQSPTPPDLSGCKVTVTGLGRTGRAAAEFLAGRGARVTVSDSRPEKDVSEAAGALAKLGIDLELGGHKVRTFTGADLIVVSPGVPPYIEPLAKARAKGVPITGEIELAARFVSAPIAAVTGTNGKTTTTSLLGEMAEAAGLKVFVGGNIGRPLIEFVSSGQETDLVVIEVSSFQLETAEWLHPRVGVLLNVTADHLDRYPDFEGYAQAKARLFARQGDEDVAVMNGDDPVVERLRVPSRRLSFSRGRPQVNGAYLNGGQIVLMDRGRRVGSLNPNRLKITGAHNQENVMAALTAALGLGLDIKSCLAAAAAFKGLPHRVELVGRYKGVAYYDDSKGTNVGAVIKSLESFLCPVVLIAGGRDKAGDFRPLRGPVRERVRTLILLGEARESMAAVLDGQTETLMASDMAEAVEMARRAAKPGDVVLLSPACASFDMFDDYKHRGRVFKDLVRKAG